MNLKEALAAHFSGQSVQVKTKGIQEPWEPLFNRIASFTFRELCSDNCGRGCEFRLAPRTIMCNGVEVPAPEKEAPQFDTEYFVPCAMEEKWYTRTTWSGHELEIVWLERGLVYVNKEDAIARAKAMLIVQEVK